MTYPPFRTMVVEKPLAWVVTHMLNMRPSELRASHQSTSCDAPDSMRPRIGSEVSAADDAVESRRGAIVELLDEYCQPIRQNTRRWNRRAAGPDPEPRSPALPDSTRTPVLRRKPGAESNGVTADLGPLSERTARPDVRRHARPTATGGVCPFHPLSPAVA